MRRELISQSINDHFTDDTLYVSWTRNGSKEVLKANIEFEIKDILGQDDFSIWNTNFKRVIEFNKIGVMRLGKVKS